MSLEEMLKRLKGYVMTPQERRAQAVSWAIGNLLIDRPEYEPQEWELRLAAVKYYDSVHP